MTGEGRRRVFVAVPTTGAMLHVVRLAPRPGLPSPTAFAAGDYRPLAISADYARLAGPAGPVARVVDGLVPHELRLSRPFDGGRSWEAPIALAHLLARDHEIVERAQDADLVAWATGAVDLDLGLIPGEYGLQRKVELSLAALPDVPMDVPVLAVLPSDPEREAARALFEGSGRAVRFLDALPVNGLPVDGLAPPEEAATGRRAWTAAAALTALVTLVGSAWLLSDRSDPPPVQPIETAANRMPAPPPPVAIQAIRTAPGSTCRAALFDATRRILQPVEAVSGAYPPVPQAPNLCGVAVAPTDATIVSEPPDAFTRVTEGERTLLFLRERPGRDKRNVVYRVQVPGESAVEHVLPAPPR